MENSMSALRSAIAPWAVMNLSRANQWIDEVRPVVKSLVSPVSRGRVDALSIAVRDARESPYGTSLGSWIGDSAEGPIIYTQASWAIPLALMFLHTPHWLHEYGPDICGVRMQMGVTNDVWQPFVMNPPVYSMVRHHALMLTAAWCWLPESDRQLWLEVMTDQLATARQRFAGQMDIVAVCEKAELRAQSLWRSPIDFSSDIKGIMADYYLASVVGIASLVRWIAALPPAQHEEALRRWSFDHQRSDFNVELMRELWRAIQTGGSWIV